MDSIKKFRNLLNILMLYATNIIVPDKDYIPERYDIRNMKKRITGKVFIQLPTAETNE